MHKLSGLILGLFIAVSAQAQSVKQEKKAIIQTLNYYIDGGTNGDVALLRKAFHADARLQGIRGNQYKLMPIDDYVKMIKPGKKSNRKGRVVTINVMKNIAHAEVLIEYPNFRFVDYMQLLKVGEEWKIVNKIYQGQRLQPKKILFVVTNHEKLGNTSKKAGTYLPEITYPFEVFNQKGYQVDFVSPKGGMLAINGIANAAVDETTRHFFRDKQRLNELRKTLSPDQVDINQYAGIYYVGGKGTMWDFPDNKKLQKITAKMYESNKVVGAVCHGPSGLLNVKLSDGSYLLAGKKATGYSNAEDAKIKHILPFLLEDRLKERGVKYSKATKKQAKHVVVSDRLVTGQNPASAAGVAEEMILLLENSNK
ncbi:nuclear transport factor 2 family protein [Microscilla marina]|uniref:ThiJ/PfpI family n=1 Tax=Microscilla marina ATCC 23134 TaxID=313606 RepID=A1ZP43_MICM2|nr:nuclear transport factor 2 family protein [Microscilla marina]EAY27835.1 ThiJ/PfpI family [Microscilla marina ATCC 23134]